MLLEERDPVQLTLLKMMTDQFQKLLLKYESGPAEERPTAGDLLLSLKMIEFRLMIPYTHTACD